MPASFPRLARRTICLLASLLVGTLLQASPAHSGPRSTPVHEGTNRPADRVSSLSVATPLAAESAQNPFGVLGPTTSVDGGDTVEKWEAVRHQIESEQMILADCAVRAECPTGARRLLMIVAEAREQQGLALAGFINRAVNLAITPTADMKQWGVPDRWSPPLETLSTGRGDCEDYAIIKYVALLRSGVPREDVKIVIVRDLRAKEEHAVTVTRVAGKWIVLDNRWLALVQDIEVDQVSPVFILDESGVRAYAPGIQATGVAALKQPSQRGEFSP